MSNLKMTTPTNIAAHIDPVDDELPKTDAALDSLLEQLRERQDRVAAELNEWRRLGKNPRAVQASISELRDMCRKMTDAAEEALKREAEYRYERDAAQSRISELERELDVLRSKLATVTADRDWFLAALGDCVKAMDLWGAQEDGVPEDGSIGKAYDNAKAILRWPDDPTLRKASSAPEPKSLTADECEQALRRGDTVRVSSMPSPYRVRCGVLESLKGGLWRLSLLNLRDIVNEVRNGAECFLVREGE